MSSTEGEAMLFKKKKLFDDNLFFYEEDLEGFVDALTGEYKRKKIGFKLLARGYTEVQDVDQFMPSPCITWNYLKDILPGKFLQEYYIPKKAVAIHIIILNPDNEVVDIIYESQCRIHEMEKIVVVTEDFLKKSVGIYQHFLKYDQFKRDIMGEFVTYQKNQGQQYDKNYFDIRNIFEVFSPHSIPQPIFKGAQ